ncbi:MAG: hypothetical protein ABI369_09005 [Acetobacteraceae bacterium]
MIAVDTTFAAPYASIIYALPPLVIYYAFRRFMTAGLTMGGVKG